MQIFVYCHSRVIRFIPGQIAKRLQNQSVCSVHCLGGNNIQPNGKSVGTGRLPNQDQASTGELVDCYLSV